VNDPINSNVVAPSVVAPVELKDKVNTTGQNKSSFLHTQDTSTELQDADTADLKKSKLLANAADLPSPSTRVNSTKVAGGRKAK